MQLVWFHPEAKELIEGDAVRWGVRETGGPLFGYERCGELVITRAFLPGSKAFHFPWLYRADREAVQAAIDQVREESKGRERWIGSWHTHPLGRARPSSVDRHTTRRIGAAKAVDCPAPVMLIQTTRFSRDGIRPSKLGAFRFSVELGDLQPLSIRVGASSS